MKNKQLKKIFTSLIIVTSMLSACLTFTRPAFASSEPFVGEIMPFAGNFAPHGWAMCQGQLMPIAQNTALFSLLGTMYGGDGRSTFGLPDLQGRIAIGMGNGPGLTPIIQGETGGSESITQITDKMPAHAHQVNVASSAAITASAVGAIPAIPQTADKLEVKAYTTGTATGFAAPIGSAWTTQPQNNMQPYLTINYIIALQGVFPPRS